MRPHRLTRHFRWVYGALVVITIFAIAGCGTRGARSTAVSVRAAPAPVADQTFKHGQLHLGPSVIAPTDATGATLNIEKNPFVAKLAGDGYKPIIQFGAYTNTGYGTYGAGMTPEEAAKARPPSSPVAGPTHLIYDHTPAWTARFVVPMSEVAFLDHGPPVGGPTTAPSSAPLMLFFVFSPDGSQVLQLLTFPPD